LAGPYLAWFVGLVQDILVVDNLVCGHNKLWLRVPLMIGDVISEKE
jgi:hypothetical protein